MYPLRHLLRAALALVFAIPANAQHIRTITVRPQHAREKLYTLKSNESIYYNEYTLLAQNKGSNYAFVIKRPSGLFLIYNGKETGPLVDARNCYGIPELWVCQTKKSASIINVLTGKTYGTYDNIYPYAAYNNPYPAFFCDKNEKKYFYDMATGKMIGPYASLSCVHWDAKKQFYAVEDSKEQWFVFNNSKKSGPFKTEPILSYDEATGNCSFRVNEPYQAFSGYYQLEDGTKIGCNPDDNSYYSSFVPLSKNKWVLVSGRYNNYMNNNRIMVGTLRFDDGKTIGPLTIFSYTLQAQDGHFAFLAADTLSKQTTVYYDGRAMGTYDGSMAIANVGDNEVYYYETKERTLYRNGVNTGLVLGGYAYNAIRTSEDKKHVLMNIGGANPGIYDKGRKMLALPANVNLSYDWGFAPDGKSGYVTYTENAALMIKTFDGRTFGPFAYMNRGESINMSADNAHLGFVAGGYAYIDGQRQNANALHMTYDNDDSAYRWLSLDKNTIYLDTYELE